MTHLLIYGIGIMLVLLIIAIYDAIHKKILNNCIIAIAFSNLLWIIKLSPRTLANLWMWVIVCALIAIWLTIGKYLMGSGDFKLIIVIIPLLAAFNATNTFLIWFATMWAVQTMFINIYQKFLHKMNIQVPAGYIIAIAYGLSITRITLF